MRRLQQTDFDVIVLGSGLSGCFTASILARHGHSVLVLDKGVHPRFTIGESTIPQTSQLIQLLSAKYDVPELQILGLRSPEGLREDVSSSSGVKRVVAFAYHEFGKEHSPDQAHHFGNVWRTENHLFRQDVDAWLMTVALDYGCEVMQGTGIDSVEATEDGVRVVTSAGDTFTGRFVVDGSGHRSVLAREYGLREEPCGLVHSSRSIFTHMIDVKELEEVAESHMAKRFREGTLHHVFERGWFWVIPFNNWEGAPNPLVSVGLTLDDHVYPEEAGASPEDEFAKFVDMLPTVAKQFENARAIRPWVRSQRIQYSSKRAIGPRFALLSHTAGFVDPLFSRGLISTVESIDAVCEALLAALKDDDFSVERFEGVDTAERRVLSFTDRLVHGAYASWDDFDLWDTWVRLWAIGAHVIESHLGSILTVGKASWVQEVEDPIVSVYEDFGYKEYFTKSYDVMARYDAGELGLEQAKTDLRSLLDAYEFRIPLRDRRMGQEWAMKNPQVRDVFLGLADRHERWERQEVDEHLKGATT